MTGRVERRKMRIADRRSRSTFWLDDAIIDRCGPWLGRYPGGTAALAVYAVLARHAGRDAEAWPGVSLLARQSGCTVRTVNRALRLLELGGLVAVYGSIDYETDRQTSNTYVLLTPPDTLPELAEDPESWPDLERGRVVVRLGKDGRREIVDWGPNSPELRQMENQNTCSPPRNDDGGEGVMVAGSPPQPLRGSRARPNKAKENLEEGVRAPEGASVVPASILRRAQAFLAKHPEWCLPYEEEGSCLDRIVRTGAYVKAR